ncbi:CDP-diacylglycerol--inositol 3-phosphatidyltransferase [Ceraceosorus guamensis]|uniref:CDP-diacylglycerol--inositol 3-phosphatidyltransferase n=1 Tax=Ceraceosorus guamensis TaxID=1522189 RepID=A0A316W7R1_9BASI|nr:CDP-diacylglycerol--inositol 3-phosphatidyltransferase [Ceraceosorus guamensis]PWN45960.1 CDP-diacylglycerol--inositol 3-phosphatidyltransferase [Ceraceosorus guamensis]
MSLATRQANAADENVFLFVPNLIGYARIILAALSLIYMKSNPKTCTLLYGVSCLLDAADGVAARRLGQSTKFGAVLDMVTDRCTTSCLLCFLTTAYPRCAILFQALITLDFSSHYIHMYSSLVTGSTSHKVVNEDVSKLLRHYYSQRWLFFYCAGNELFFVCLYLLDFYPTPLGLEPSWFLAPLPSSLQLHLTRLAVDQPKGAVGLAFALVRRTTWPQIAALVTLPICAAKQLFNALQFWKAAKVLVGIDLIERAKKREKQEE